MYSKSIQSKLCKFFFNVMSISLKYSINIYYKSGSQFVKALAIVPKSSEHLGNN